MRRMLGSSMADASDAIAANRVRLHLAQRLGSRAFQLISPRGSARTAPWAAAAVGCAALDVAIARWLRRNPRLALAPRLALDAADIALWSTAAADDFEAQQTAVMPGIPLAVEAGARLGLAGLVVPVVNGVVASAVRRRRGQPARAGQLAWQVVGTVGGVGLAAYGRHRRRLELERHERELAPRLDAAELAGMHEHAMGADPLLDRVQRATALIDLAVPGGHRREVVGEWKAALAATTRARFAYLGDAVARWQATHNDTPDLRQVVRVEVAASIATTVLAADQIEQLESALDARGLRGRASVEPAKDGGNDDPRCVTVDVVTLDGARHAIRLVTTVAPPRLVFDPVPAAFLWSALWSLVPAGGWRERVPLAVVAPAAAAAVALSRQTAARAAVDGLAPRGPAVASSLALTAITSAAVTLTQREPWAPDGTSRYPFGIVLQGYELVAFISWGELSSRQRAVAAAAGVGVVGMSWLLTPRPRSGGALAGEVIWPLVTAISGGGWPRAIAGDTAALGERLAADDDARLADARRDGREVVLALVRTSLAEARRQLDQRGHEMAPDLRAEAERRLDAITFDLETLS